MSSLQFSLGLATVPVLEDIAREGARRMLQQAIEQEVAQYIEEHRHQVDERGHRLAVRNGRKPPRMILSGCGPLEVSQPRVDDKRLDESGQVPDVHVPVLVAVPDHPAVAEDLPLAIGRVLVTLGQRAGLGHQTQDVVVGVAEGPEESLADVFLVAAARGALDRDAGSVAGGPDPQGVAAGQGRHVGVGGRAADVGEGPVLVLKAAGGGLDVRVVDADVVVVVLARAHLI